MKLTHRLQFACLTLVATSVALPAAQQAPEHLARAAIIETAERFASVRWRAEERHVLHGEDADGVRIDTPDVTLDATGWKVGEGNIGMPYCWGGFTGLDQFEDELAEARFAGHVPNRGNARGSGRTLGVDCSGFVSRCWSLPTKQSTRSLGALCYELDDFEQLLPGDIVNRFDAHVALFTSWADDEHTSMLVLEAASIKVMEGTYALADLRAQGFRPMRYKLLDERWQTMPATSDAGAAISRRGFVLQSAGADSSDPLPAALRAGETRAGDWASFDATEDHLRGPSVTSTWMAVESPAGTLELQRLLAVGADTLATGVTLSTTEEWSALLVAAANFSNPLQDLELITSSADLGTYRLGERELPARRVTALIEGQMLSRSTLYPVVLEVECVVSDEVPLLGLCELNLELEIEYGTSGEERVIGVSERSYLLTNFGRGQP